MTDRSSSAASDEGLMAAIAAGDESAYHVFFRRHSPDVFALCLRILNDRGDAEDVLVEVFWEIWSKAARYDPARGNPRTYLMLLSRSRAIDRRRERVGRQERHGRSSAELIRRAGNTAYPVSPHRDVVTKENHEILLEAVRSLVDTQRRPLEMAFFEDMSHREIAQALGSPLGTIKTRIRKGLAQLRAKLRTLDERRDS